MLWQHHVKIGCVGYSERLHRKLPYYFTYFGSKILCIDLIMSEVEWLESWKGTLTNLYIKKYKTYNEVVVEIDGRQIPIYKKYKEENKPTFFSNIKNIRVIAIEKKNLEKNMQRGIK